MIISSNDNKRSNILELQHIHMEVCGSEMLNKINC